MGRYENALKFVQLRSMIEEKNYDEALEIAEQLEMGKIKDVSELKLIADVYRKCGNYKRAKELYYVIYGEYNIRRNLYTLIMICLKDKSFDEAEGLYKDYITIDKGSIFRYILRYRIDKSKDSDIDVIIKDLEKIKEEFYMEDWGFELARLYHKAGRIEECLAECDDLILWFGEGEVVEKAKLLKMHYDENVDGDILHDLQTSIGNDISKYMDEKSQEDNVQSEDVQVEDVQAEDAKVEDAEELSDNSEQAEEAADTSGVIHNDIDNEQLKNNALSEAAGLMNVIKEAAKNNQKEVEVVSFGENGLQIPDESEETELTFESESDDKPEKTDGSEATAETKATAESEEQNNYKLSKYGSRFNYIDANELYDRMDIGVHAPANYAIALGNSDDATDIVRGIAKRIKAQGYLKNPKIARISASKLNNIRLYDQIDELIGTCMLIEDVSEMSPKTVNVIIKIMDAHAAEIVMIYVDKEERLSRFLLKEPILCNQIDNFVLN